MQPMESNISEKEYDPVNKPAHYTKGGIECIEAIEASMSSEEFIGFLKGNALKYLWRYRNKNNPVEDLKKAIWYINRLIDVTSSNHMICDFDGEIVLLSK